MRRARAVPRQAPPVEYTTAIASRNSPKGSARANSMASKPRKKFDPRLHARKRPEYQGARFGAVAAARAIALGGPCDAGLFVVC